MLGQSLQHSRTWDSSRGMAVLSIHESRDLWAKNKYKIISYINIHIMSQKQLS
jgi:hypothetical protein